MIVVNLPAIDGSAVINEIMERSVRMFGRDGISEYDALRALMTADLMPDEIERISKCMSNQHVEYSSHSKVSS